MSNVAEYTAQCFIRVNACCRAADLTHEVRTETGNPRGVQDFRERHEASSSVSSHTHQALPSKIIRTINFQLVGQKVNVW